MTLHIAVEQLLKGYRELEKSKITYERARDLQENKRIVDNNYISKSKIKEKIELLEKLKQRNIKRNFDTVYKEGYFTGGIDCLQELMEDK